MNKKMLTFLLLLVLPLQFAWATVAGHCQHASMPVSHMAASEHCHDHHVASLDVAQADTETIASTDRTGALDHDCVACHLGSALPFLMDVARLTTPAMDSPVFFYNVSLSSTFSRRPDRPQWQLA